jgi:hypothetical protein
MIKQIDIPIYDAVVVVFLSPTAKQVNAWSKPMIESDIMDDEDLAELLSWVKGDTPDAGFTQSYKHANYAIYVREGLDDHDTVAHEVFHCVNRILKDRGVEMSGEGEAYAYLIGYLTGKIYNQKK